MSVQKNAPDNRLLRSAEGSKCEPRIVQDLYPRVVDWGMPEDVNAGDFTFAVLETALEVGASEIQLTPLEKLGEVSVHFKIGSEFIAQQPLTPIQFGFIAILLAHIATLSRHVIESPSSIRYFYSRDQRPYYIRFSKIRLADRSTAILISLFVTEESRESDGGSAHADTK
ncbi:MAG TPA: hypothetical protein VNU49_08140 [Opitutaceae bacterium]|jgi:hypothetical protein|nr:hypothetical protein [Opitutaceae bacterium]